MNYDSFGNEGLFMDYAMIFFFTGGALLLLTYCYKKKILNLDESPKFEMMKEDEDDTRN